jgi:hypothetical protein
MRPLHGNEPHRAALPAGSCMGATWVSAPVLAARPRSSGLADRMHACSPARWPVRRQTLQAVPAAAASLSAGPPSSPPRRHLCCRAKLCFSSPLCVHCPWRHGRAADRLHASRDVTAHAGSHETYMPDAPRHALPRRRIWCHYREQGWRYGLLRQLHKVSAGVCGMLLQIILGADQITLQAALPGIWQVLQGTCTRGQLRQMMLLNEPAYQRTACIPDTMHIPAVCAPSKQDLTAGLQVC